MVPRSTQRKFVWKGADGSSSGGRTDRPRGEGPNIPPAEDGEDGGLFDDEDAEEDPPPM